MRCVVAAVCMVKPRAVAEDRDFADEYRLVMPDGAVTHVAVVASRIPAEGASVDFIGAVIEAHGGRLWADENTPRGAVLHFTMPVAQKT